jgi:hypothetical protein
MFLPSRRVSTRLSARSRASCCDTAGWRSFQQLLDLGDRLLAFDQQAENHQPRLVRKRLEEFACGLRVLQQFVDIEVGPFRLACQCRRHVATPVPVQPYMRHSASI